MTCALLLADAWDDIVSKVTGPTGTISVIVVVATLVMRFFKAYDEHWTLINSESQQVLERSKEDVAGLAARLEAMEKRLDAALLELSQKDARIAVLEGTVAERDRKIVELEHRIAAREHRINELEVETNDRDLKIAALEAHVQTLGQQIAELRNRAQRESFDDR